MRIKIEVSEKQADLMKNFIESCGFIKDVFVPQSRTQWMATGFNDEDAEEMMDDLELTFEGVGITDYKITKIEDEDMEAVSCHVFEVYDTHNQNIATVNVPNLQTRESVAAYRDGLVAEAELYRHEVSIITYKIVKGQRMLVIF